MLRRSAGSPTKEEGKDQAPYSKLLKSPPSTPIRKSLKKDDDDDKEKKPRDPSPAAMKKMPSTPQGQYTLVTSMCRILPFLLMVFGVVYVLVFPEFLTRTMPQFLRGAGTPSFEIVLPNVLVIGAQHAGAAEYGDWLIENGVCHPQVLEGEPQHSNKGVRFFNDKKKYEQGLEYYSKRYEHCKNQTLIMDASPNTLPHPSHVENIYKQAGGDHLKNLKVVAILREPITRELSLYNHKEYTFQQTKDKNQWYSDVGKDDGSAKSFDEYLDAVLGGMEPTEWGIGHMGLYAEHLKKWFSFVDRKNFLVISYEEVEKDHEMVDQRIRDFLGQDFSGSSKGVTERPGVPSCSAQERLNKVFGPMNEELYKLLKENPGPTSEQAFPAFKNPANCGARLGNQVTGGQKAKAEEKQASPEKNAKKENGNQASSPNKNSSPNYKNPTPVQEQGGGSVEMKRSLRGEGQK